MNKALEIKNVDFGYSKDQKIFENLSLEVYQGEYVCVIGHNGSGKSTLAKLISGLEEPIKGTIEVFSLEINEKNIDEIRKNVGIVFQNPDNQFIGNTVKDDIAFGLENLCVKHEDMDSIIHEYAKKVDMLDFLEKEPSNLSGGQKQRVAIAGILAMKPKLLILDEATSMLDPKGKSEIIRLTHLLKKENPELTIISITHDIEEALLCDKVIVINKGKVELIGKPEEVFSNEEKLKAIRLDIPFTYKLNIELNKKGIKVDSKDFEGIVKELCR